MVIHDREQQEQWAERQMNEQRHKQRKEREPRRVSVVAVQCLACAAAVLLALVFRMAGGDAYAQLQHGLESALNGNELMTAVMRLWDEDLAEPDAFASDGDVKGNGFTSDEAVEKV